MNCSIPSLLMNPRGLLSVKWRGGFTLVEVMVGVFIFALLLSISLSAFSRSVKPDPVLLTADQLALYVGEAQAEARASDETVALVINNDPASPDYQRSLNIAALVPTDDASDLFSATLSFNKKWLRLPVNTVIEFAYSNNAEPNVFSTSEQGGSTLSFTKTSMSGAANVRHPAVRCLLIDKYGALNAHKLNDSNVTLWKQYVNATATVTQKGGYLIIRNSQKRPDPYKGGTDSSHLAKLYISPLTGKISKI